MRQFLNDLYVVMLICFGDCCCVEGEAKVSGVKKGKPEKCKKYCNTKARITVQGNLLEQTEEVVDVWQEEGRVRLQEQLNIFVRDIAPVQTHLKKVSNHMR